MLRTLKRRPNPSLVSQEFQLDALLDLPAVARVDGLQHHRTAHLGDPAVGARHRELHVVGGAMRHQHDVRRLLLLLRRRLRRLLLLGIGDPYPQGQQ
jgi:hypothetical protein